MINIGILSSGVTRAYLNAVGKMPELCVLMMCVSDGRSVGEMACRRGDGMGSIGQGLLGGWK